jgi:hypothetical protein
MEKGWTCVKPKRGHEEGSSLGKPKKPHNRVPMSVDVVRAPYNNSTCMGRHGFHLRGG